MRSRKSTFTDVATYNISRIGGRVKAASIGMEVLYPPEYERFRRDPTPTSAYALYQQLRQLREQPTAEFLHAFFPHDGAKIRQFMRGTGFYRPVLKTDQGPAGNFFGFEVGGTHADEHRITGSEGLAVPENHLLNRIQEGDLGAMLCGTPVMIGSTYRIRELMGEMIAAYREHRLETCGRVLEELEGHMGSMERKATVGRGPFFYCKPSMTEQPIHVPEHTAVKIETVTQELLERTSSKAMDVMQRFRRGTSLEEAVQNATAQDVGGPSALYVQPDVFIDCGGNPQIEKINVPDLMMFLTALPETVQGTFGYIQGIANRLRDIVIDKIAATYTGKVHILTRDEVLDRNEDTLEHLEILAILRGLGERKREREVIRADQVRHLRNGNEVLLLNINPYDPKYHELLRRVANDEIVCFPNPFLKALEGEMTTLPTHHIAGKQKEHFLGAIRPGTQLKDTAVFERHRAIDAIYAHGGLESEVLYFTVPGERTPIPTIRHSVHSFSALYNICKKQGFPDLTMREIPIGRENSQFVDGNGGRMAVHRFLATVN